jgi:hypothetical protein
MTDASITPFYRSFLLGRTVHLDGIADMPLRDLDLLNVETRAALQEATEKHQQIEDKNSEEASTEYRRMKIARYFQAAIEIALKNR